MTNREFHHFQFVDAKSGQMPLSISILIRYPKSFSRLKGPITADDLIELDSTLKHFSGSLTEFFSQVEKKTNSN